MPQHVEVPGMGIVEFPDGMGDDAITAAIQRNVQEMNNTPSLTPTPQPFLVDLANKLSIAAPSIFGRPGLENDRPDVAPQGLMPTLARMLQGNNPTAASPIAGAPPEPGLLHMSPKELIPEQGNYPMELARQGSGMLNLENLSLLKGLGALHAAKGPGLDLLKSVVAAYFTKQGVEQGSQALGERTAGVDMTPQRKAETDFQTIMGVLMALSPLGLREAQPRPSGLKPGDIGTNPNLSDLNTMQGVAPPERQIPQFAGLTTSDPSRFNVAPSGQAMDMSQLTELERLALLRKNMALPEEKRTFEQPVDLQTPQIGQNIILPDQPAAPFNPVLQALFPTPRENPGGGQIGFAGQAPGLPNAGQQAAGPMGGAQQPPGLFRAITDIVTSKDRLSLEQERDRLAGDKQGQQQAPGMGLPSQTTDSLRVIDQRLKELETGVVDPELEHLRRTVKGPQPQPKAPVSDEPLPVEVTSEPAGPQKALNDSPEVVGRSLGLTFNPKVQASGVDLSSVPPKMASKMKRTWEFTDREKGSKTEGMTFYVPEGSTRQTIEEAFRTKQNSWEPKLEVPLGDKLKQRLKDFNDAQSKRRQNIGLNLDAGLFGDVVNIGKLAYGVAKDFGEWSIEMTKRLGEHVKPHLKEVWDEVKRVVDTRPKQDMVMESGELVAQPHKLKLGLNKEGQYDAGQAVARLRNVLGEKSSEWQILKDAKIEEQFKSGQKVKPEELRKWIDDNSPKIEVKKYQSEQPVHAYVAALSEAEHKLDTLGYDLVRGQRPSENVLVDRKTGENVNIGTYKYNQLPVDVRNVVEKVASLRKTIPGQDSEQPHWGSIAPKAEKDMPGYVEIAVVKPRKVPAKGYESIVERNKPEHEVQFPESHNFPPNTLAFARGYMETMPDGKKVFHVVEVQSDWAQRARFEKENLPPEGQDTLSDYSSHRKAGSEPLLQHYERLALKAVIEHAKKEGADAVAISDAETAMMTEGHDRATGGMMVKGGFAKKAEAQKALDELGEGHHLDYVDGLWGVYTNTGKITQEPGMRLHYDRTLPKIAEELTGSKGVPVDFGEHRMATDNPTAQNMGTPSSFRKDLVFKNSDGTPKTSTTARMYDLSKAKERAETEKPTILGKDKPVERAKPEDVKQKLEPAKGGLQVKAAVSRNQEAGSFSLQPLKDILDRLETDRHVLGRMFSREGLKNRDAIAAKRDAVDNATMLTGERVENHVTLEATRVFGKDKAGVADEAAWAVMEAKGDRTKLTRFLSLVTGKNAKAEAAVKFAMANWDKLQKVIKAVQDGETMNRAMAATAGIKVQSLEDQVKNLYAKDPRGFFFDDTKSSVKGLPATSKHTYNNIFEAIADGKEPQTLKVSAMIGKRTTEIQAQINLKGWLDAFRKVTDSKTRLPIVDDLDKKQVPKEGYKKIPGLNVSILSGYHSLFDAVTGESKIANSTVGQALLKTEGGIKHGTLAFDSFHGFRVANFMKSFGAKVGFQKGLSLLEYSKSDLDEAIKQGLAPKEAKVYQDEVVDVPQGKFTRREAGSILTRNGLNIGRHSEALYVSFIRNTPGFKQTLGKSNKFIFDKLSRGAMYEAGQVEFERMAKQYPTMPIDQVARKVSKDLNVRFGNLGRQGVFKSKTMQDLTQLVFLAPRWVESMARSELGSVYQLGKSIGTGKLDSLGKSTGTLLVAYLLGTQAINFVFNGRLTFGNPNNKGHEIDAYIPPLTKNGKGFWLSPLSVVAELTHDMLRYTRKTGDSVLDAAATIVKNKFSPLTQAEEMLRTGRDWKGDKVTGWERVKQAAFTAVNPTPLPLRQAQQAVKDKDIAPFERQAFAAVGLKAEPESYDDVRQRRLAEMKDKSIPARAKLEKELKADRPTATDSALLSAATRKIEKLLQNKDALKGKLDAPIRDWMDAKNLHITGYAPELGYHKEKVHLSDSEQEFYLAEVARQYNFYLKPLVGKDVKQEIIDKRLTQARNRARAMLRKKIHDDSTSGTAP